MICPFCQEDDFDQEGLKLHLLAGWCESFENIPQRKPYMIERLERLKKGNK